MSSVSFKGPLFDGRLAANLDKAMVNIEEAVADEAVKLVREVISTKAKHRTGRYERAVKSNRESSSYQVTDGGVRYGAWLEGTSRRNARSSFKGYHQFQTARRQLDRTAKQIIQAEISKALGGR